MSSHQLTINPAQLEFVIRPGATLTQAYTVTNNGDTPLILSTQVLPFLPSGSDGAVTYDNIPQNFSYHFSLSNSDLQLGQSFILAPGQHRQLVLKLTLDSNTSLSDSYFTFFLVQQNNYSSDPYQSRAAASLRLGSHLLFSASADENPPQKLTVKNFTVSPRFKDIFFPRLTFNAEIFNSTTFFAKSVGTLTLTKNNAVIRQLDLFPQNVLSQSSRNLLCISKNPKLAEEPVACTLNPPFWPGAYTATLTLDPSLSSPTLSITFYVFPYSALALLFFFFSLFILLLRHRKHVT